MGVSTTGKYKSLDELEDKVAAEWGKEFAKAKGLMNGFIKSHPARLHERPTRNSKESGRAWPSRRTWDFTQRAWATAVIIGTDETARDSVVEGCVGAAASSEFFTYAASAGLPDPTAVLSGSWLPDPSRLDLVIGAYSSMVSYVVDRKAKLLKLNGMSPATASDEVAELGSQAWEAIGKLLHLQLSDVVVPACKVLGNAGFGRDNPHPKLKDASKPIFLALDKMGVHNI